MPKYKNVLVIGSRGLLGTAVTRVLSDRRYRLILPENEDFDVTDQEQVLEFLRHHWPDLIVNCSGVTDIEENEDEKDIWPELVNRYGPLVLAGFCTDLGIPLVHFSSSFVFDGEKSGPYTEDDPPSPVNRYGVFKAEADEAVLSECPHALVVRTSCLFGPGRTNYASLVARKAQVGEPIEAPPDVLVSTTYTFDVAEVTADLIESGATGLYHVVNAGSVSYYDLAARVLELVGLKGELVPVPAEIFRKAKTPPNLVLSTAKLERDFGVVMRHWDEALQEYIRDYLDSDILLSDDITEAEAAGE